MKEHLKMLKNDMYIAGISQAILKLLQSKYVRCAHVNSKLQLDVGIFTLNFIRKLEIPN